jgi:signal transduction histidine kinase
VVWGGKGTPDPIARLTGLANDVVDTLVAHLHLGAAAVIQSEPTGWRVIASRDSCGLGLEIGPPVQTGETVWSTSVATALADHLDLPQVLRRPSEDLTDGDDQIATALVAPIVLDDGVLVGAIAVMDPREVTVTPMDHTLLGTFARLLAVVYEDVWTFRELEAEHAGAEQRTDHHQRLVAEVVHDFRTPLAVIVGMAEVIDRFPADEERIRLAARAISANAYRLGTMVDGLLEAEKRDLSLIEEEPQPIDLAILAREIADEVRHLVSVQVLDVQHDGRGSVTAPPTALRRLLLNLVANAVRNTVRGTVRIEAHATADGAHFVVSDTGRGMSREDAARFSTAYARADDSSGFGLGLSIVQRLTRAMGGEIALTSEPGEGTTFRLRIPHATRPHEESATAPR